MIISRLPHGPMTPKVALSQLRRSQKRQSCRDLRGASCARRELVPIASYNFIGFDFALGFITFDFAFGAFFLTGALLGGLFAGMMGNSR